MVLTGTWVALLESLVVLGNWVEHPGEQAHRAYLAALGDLVVLRDLVALQEMKVVPL